jgi:HAD superfamily hydrolase (TIGR01509 family)
MSLAREKEEMVIHELWGRPHREVLVALLGERGGVLEEAVRLYNEHLLGGTFLNCLRLVPGSIEVLNQLKDDYILTIASAGNPEVLKEKVIPHFGIPDVFRQILTSRELSDPTRGKPHADLALEIMQAQGVEPGETLVVGDGASDVLMAQSAGVLPVVVLTGQLTKEKAQELGVECIIPDIAELPTILQGL